MACYGANRFPLSTLRSEKLPDRAYKFRLIKCKFSHRLIAQPAMHR